MTRDEMKLKVFRIDRGFESDSDMNCDGSRAAHLLTSLYGPPSG